MRKGHLIFSAVQFLIITALFIGGAVFLGLHYLPNARILCAQWLLGAEKEFFFLGSLVVALALFLTVCFWVMQRGSYVRIQMEKSSFAIDERVIRELVCQTWRESFPEKPLPSDIYVAQKQIEIIAEEAAYDLQELEAVLGQKLSAQFGYEHPFYVTLKSP